MQRLLPAVLLAICLHTGCDKSPSLQEVHAKNDAIAAELEAETGHEVLVGYLQDGSEISITVTFVGMTQPDADAAKPRVEAAVKRHWPKVVALDVKAQP